MTIPQPPPGSDDRQSHRSAGADHLDAEQIALLDILSDAELTDPAIVAEWGEAAAVTPADRLHLLACDVCIGPRDLLRKLPPLLQETAARTPEHIPLDVSARITASVATLTATDTRGATVVAMPSREERSARRHATPWLQAAAVVSVLALGSALVVGALRQGSESDTSSAPTGGSTPAAAMAPAAGAAGGAADAEAAAGSVPAVSGLAATSSGAAYTTSSLPQLALTLAGGLRSTTRAPADQSKATSVASAPATGLRDDCLAALPGGPGLTAILVDSGSWQGAPARLVVYRFDDDPHRGGAYVVRPSCSAQSVGVLSYAAVTLP